MTPPAAQTLAAAFVTDPGFEWILPNVATRLRRLTAIFKGSVTHANRHGGVVSLDDDRAIGVWLPDRRAVIGPADAARGHMLTLPFTIGVTSMQRLNRAEKHGQAFLRLHITTPYAYLMALAVHPDRQGNGLASRVIDEVSDKARSAGFQTLALRTENPRNVDLYRHLGFNLHASHHAPSSHLDVAVMSKPL